MIELTLPDMSCGHCVKTVTQVLQRLDPAAQVQVDLAAKTVQVQTKQSADVVKAALAEEGYPAADDGAARHAQARP